jgi:hypothetical protein
MKVLDPLKKPLKLYQLKHTRVWGCMQHEYLCGSLPVHVVSTQARVNSWSSCIFTVPHLPCFPVKLRSSWWCEGPAWAPLSVNLAVLVVGTRKFICLYDFCSHMSAATYYNKIVVNGKHELPPHACSVLRGGQHWFLDGEVWPSSVETVYLLTRLSWEGLLWYLQLR